MKPIDKFIDIDVIIDFCDNENRLTEYVWKMAMHLMSYIDEDTGCISSDCVKIFKKRYNERAIKMPLSYNEYLNNHDIQHTITDLGYEVEKFWFVLLFIYDYSKGVYTPPKDTKVINNSLADFIYCQDFDDIEDIIIPSSISKTENELIYENTNHLIVIFAKLFNQLFSFDGESSRNSKIYIKKRILISRLIYLTKISNDKHFYNDSTILNSYLSRYSSKSIKKNNNRFYKMYKNNQ